MLVRWLCVVQKRESPACRFFKKLLRAVKKCLAKRPLAHTIAVPQAARGANHRNNSKRRGRRPRRRGARVGGLDGESRGARRKFLNNTYSQPRTLNSKHTWLNSHFHMVLLIILHESLVLISCIVNLIRHFWESEDISRKSPRAARAIHMCSCEFCIHCIYSCLYSFMYLNSPSRARQGPRTADE